MAIGILRINTGILIMIPRIRIIGIHIGMPTMIPRIQIGIPTGIRIGMPIVIPRIQIGSPTGIHIGILIMGRRDSNKIFKPIKEFDLKDPPRRLGFKCTASIITHRRHRLRRPVIIAIIRHRRIFILDRRIFIKIRIFALVSNRIRVTVVAVRFRRPHHWRHNHHWRRNHHWRHSHHWRTNFMNRRREYNSRFIVRSALLRTIRTKIGRILILISKP